MFVSPRAGKVKLNQLLAAVVVIILGFAAAWWYFHGGDKKAKEALDKAQQAAGDAKNAAEQNVQNTNAGFDASRERQTEKRTGGMGK